MFYQMRSEAFVTEKLKLIFTIILMIIAYIEIKEAYTFRQPSKLINVPDPTTVIFFPCFILYLIKERLLINLQSELKHKMINLFKVSYLKSEWSRIQRQTSVP